MFTKLNARYFVRLLKRPMGYIGVLILFACFTCYSFYLWQSQSQVRIPRNIAEKVLFPVYTPRHLPEGYSVTNGSYHIKDDVLIFSLSKDNAQVINITEEARPQGFDFNSFYQSHLQSAKSVIGAPSPAVIGTLQDGTRVASMVTDNTWILISGPSNKVSDNDIRFLLASIMV